MIRKQDVKKCQEVPRELRNPLSEFGEYILWESVAVFVVVVVGEIEVACVILVGVQKCLFVVV